MNDTCSARRVNLITVHAYVFYSLYVVNGSLLMNLTGESSVIRAINAQGGVYMFGRMLPISSAGWMKSRKRSKPKSWRV